MPASRTTPRSRRRASGDQLAGTPMTTWRGSRASPSTDMWRMPAACCRLQVHSPRRYAAATSFGCTVWARRMSRALFSAAEVRKPSPRCSGRTSASLNQRKASSSAVTWNPQRAVFSLPATGAAAVGVPRPPLYPPSTSPGSHEQSYTASDPYLEDHHRKETAENLGGERGLSTKPRSTGVVEVGEGSNAYVVPKSIPKATKEPGSERAMLSRCWAARRIFAGNSLGWRARQSASCGGDQFVNEPCHVEGGLL